MSKETKVKKINQEEYNILKGLDDRWKWLARDSDTFLWAYETEPRRFVHSSGLGVPETVCHFIGGDQFHFVGQEDESAYNIAELIKEYEAEESEMSEEEFDEMIEEELETYIEESVETFFRPFIDQYEEEETYKDVYLNKYEVYSLIKDLADSSEPMVSAPTYDYYEINAGLLLEKITSMDGVVLEEVEE